MKLEKKVTIEIVPPQSIEIDEIIVTNVIDDRTNKKITARIVSNTEEKRFLPGVDIILWSGEKEYEEAGQWTDEDVDKRLTEILTK